ncbi:hypothetical protein EKD04_007895 [Chloroflexales bacterium ZM16-3]|nr:hypothetical protein [Chloroflexales bacterium ZM16-3]
MEMIIAMTLFAVLVACWVILPASPASATYALGTSEPLASSPARHMA